MKRYNDIRGDPPYPFNLTSIRSFSSPSPITMSTSCPLGIAFAVRPSAVAEQVETIDKKYLLERRGAVSDDVVMTKLTKALQIQIGAVERYN